MATQDKSPVTNLMEGLGIGMEEATNDANSNENFDQDSDGSTQMDDTTSETSGETETPSGDTVTADDEMSKLQAELETMRKRMSDKDKYINELKNSQGKPEQGETESVSQSETELDDDFWSDPEAKYKALLNELKSVRQEISSTNFKVDESVYAATKQDYYKIVNEEAISAAAKEDPNFVTELQSQGNKFEFAYNYLKNRVDSKTAEKNALEAEIRAKVMKEFGVEEEKRKTPPVINNLGGSGNAGKSEMAEDGFAAVFGY